MNVGIEFIWILYLVSLVTNAFSIVFQSKHQFQLNGLLLRLLSAFLGESLNSQFRWRFTELKMAFSQVEIVSSSPFGCVLRDHNRRERCSMESNSRTTFHKNLKNFVRDHIHTCISNPSPDENSKNANGWVPNHNNNDKPEDLLSPNSRRHARVLQRWARAGEIVTAIDRQNHEQRENSPAQSDGSVEISNLGGVSSLVQRWRNFTEARLNENAGSSNNPNSSSPVCSTSKSNSGALSTYTETAPFVEVPPAPLSETCDSVDERFDTPSMITEDSFMDWESDRTAPSGPPSVQGRDSDSGESERLRVADVIRKLTSENQMQGCLVSWKNDNDRDQNFGNGNESLPRLRIVSVSDHKAEQRCFSPVRSSPRIRGRQAFNDLLMKLERDRHRELDTLVERRAVSRFSHRGRIQSLLRLRFLRRGAEVGFDQEHSQAMAGGGGVQQRLHREAATEAQQRSHSRAVVGGVQQNSRCEAAVEAPHHLLHEGEFGAHEHVCHEQDSSSKGVGEHSHSMPSESSQNRQVSTVVLLREKFNVPVEHNVANPKTRHGAVVNNVVRMKNPSSSYQMGEEPHHQEVNITMQQSTISTQDLVSDATDDGHEKDNPSSDAIRKATGYEVCNLESQESAERLTTSNGREEDVNAEEQDANNQQLQVTREDMINDLSHPEGDWEEEEARNHQLMESDREWIMDVSRRWSEWDEEQEDYNQQIIATNHDWISDVSRPISDWEGLRQARYQEMLDPYLDNQEIRQLLERRSVTTFLSSNLRETMDQLMISRIERLPQSISNDQEDERALPSRLEQLMLSRIERQTQTMHSQQSDEEEQEVEEEEERNEQQVEEEEEEGEDEDDDENDDDDDADNDDEEEEEEEEEESQIRHQYSEVDDYEDQVAAGVSSWSHNGDNEISDDFDQVASPSSQQSRSNQASYSGTRLCSSFTNRSSMVRQEMELIYDMRGHMEQLHHEISELRKSIRSCVNMQANLQRSIKHEVADAVSRSVRGVEKEPNNGGLRKGSCCVCYEMRVDSLLYRCGHMCTCFKCAHELQWSSGKCPICRAPIVDVVRAYPNDS